MSENKGLYFFQNLNEMLCVIIPVAYKGWLYCFEAVCDSVSQSLFEINILTVN